MGCFRRDIDYIQTDPPENPINGQLWYVPGSYIRIYLNGHWVKYGVREASGSGGTVVSTIGVPTDSTYDDGLIGFTPETRISDAIDDINETLKYLAPEDAPPLEGDFLIETTNTQAYVSDGISLTNIQPGNLARCIKGSTLTVRSPDFNKADIGMLTAYLNDNPVDTFNLGTHFSESERTGCQSYPPASGPNEIITVTRVCKYNDFPKWQQGSARLTFTNLETKDHKIKLTHRISETVTHSTNNQTIFVDAESGRPAISSPPTVELKSAAYKYLSGVRYYTLNTKFSVSFKTNNKIFEYTYVQTPIKIEFPGAYTINLPLNDSSISGVSNPPKYNEQIIVNNKEIVLNKQDESSFSAKVLVTPIDPWGQGTVATENISNKRLITTYKQKSTDTSEYFQDEVYRLPPDYNFESTSTSFTNKWDSTQLLFNGNAQVIPGALIYPQTDFTSNYEPTQTANYSSFSGDQTYYRAFYTTDPRSSGTIVVGNITESDLGANLSIFIKLPTQTGWLSLQDPFNAATFTGSDNDGARTSLTQSNSDLHIGWSSGTKSTANSNGIIYIKVILHNDNVQITKLIFT